MRSPRLKGLFAALVALGLMLVPILLGQQVPGAVVQPLGAPDLPAGVQGLAGQAERSPDGTFRWSGDTVRLPVPALGYPLRVQLHVAGPRNPGDSPPPLTGTATGFPVGAQPVPPGYTALTYTLPLRALLNPQPDLVLTTTLYQPRGDRRQLGVVFYDMTTTGGPLPAPGPLTGWLLSGALLWLTARLGTRRDRPAWAVAGAWGVAVGLLVAFARAWAVESAWFWVAPALGTLLLVPTLRDWYGGRPRRLTPPLSGAQPPPTPVTSELPPSDPRPPTPDPRPARRQMGALTGLRFWPSLYVVLFHFGGIVMADAPEPLQRLRVGAPVSVDLFYLLSGFVLTYNYLADRPLRTRSFWGARFARIYPSYLLSLILVAPFILYLHFTSLPPGQAIGLTAVEGVAVGLLVQAWLPALALAWNYPAWSLSVEIFFYVVFPWLGRHIKRLGAGVLAALLPVGWALALVGPLLVWWGTTLPDAAIGRTLGEIGLYNPLIRLPESLLGVLLGRLFLLRGPLPRSGWWAWAALAGLALVLMTGPGEAEGVWTPYYRATIVPLFGLLIYALAEGSGWVARAFDHPIMRRLGEASYAIYLLQVPVALIVEAVMQPRPIFAAEKEFIQPFATWPNFLIYFAILVAVCLATERLIEIPLRDRIRARLSARPNATAPPPGLQI